MKRILIALIVVLVGHTSYSQVVGTFEQWDNRIYLLLAPPIIPLEIVTYSDPDGWTSLNQLSQSNFFGNKVNAVIDTNSVEGSFSAKVMTDTVSIAGFGTLPMPGVLINGEFSIDLLGLLLGGGDIDPFSIAEIGQPYSQKPSKFSGYYRYNPVGVDSCLFTVILMSQGEPIGGGVFISGGDTDSSFVYFEAPVEYFGCGVPDTLVIIATSSSAGLAGGNVGSALYIDSLGLYVPPGGVNTGVIARNDTVFTLENNSVTIEVLNNDEDCDEDTLEVTSIIDQPSNGSVVINGDGSITYTPNTSYSGVDEFSYSACDPDMLCDTAYTSVDVQKSTGLSEIEELSYSSYYDKISKSLSIKFNRTDDYRVDIIQIDGRVIRSIEFIGVVVAVDVSNLNQGIYFVRLRGKKELIDNSFRLMVGR